MIALQAIIIIVGVPLVVFAVPAIIQAFTHYSNTKTKYKAGDILVEKIAGNKEPWVVRTLQENALTIKILEVGIKECRIQILRGRTYMHKTNDITEYEKILINKKFELSTLSQAQNDLNSIVEGK